MEILSLSFDPDHSDVTGAAFRASVSCLDYEAVIWAPANTLHEYSWTSRFQGNPRASESDSPALIQDFARRRREFSEMLKLGRPVVILLSEPVDVAVDTGERQYSGTGRNRQTTIVVSTLRVLSAAPEELRVEKGFGENIEFKGNEPLSSFWRRLKDNFFYEAYFDVAIGTPFLLVSGTERAVGTLKVYPSGGVLLVLPSLGCIDGLHDYESELRALDGDDDAIEKLATDYSEQFQEAHAFIGSLQELLIQLKAQSGEFTLPEWASSYAITGERETTEELLRRRQVLDSAQESVAEQERTLAELERRKLLFSGTGRALEIIVKEAVEALGFDVEEPRQGRDDWIATSPEGVFVLEVKGLSGSAGEKDAAQLEKWVSTYFEEDGSQPKGLLLVNAFRDVAIDDRNQEAFPDQMLAYSESRKHCLLTGIQLLGLWTDVEKNPDHAAELRVALFEAVGRFPDFSDWRDFLEAVSREADEPEDEG